MKRLFILLLVLLVVPFVSAGVFVDNATLYYTFNSTANDLVGRYDATLEGTPDWSSAAIIGESLSQILGAPQFYNDNVADPIYTLGGWYKRNDTCEGDVGGGGSTTNRYIFSDGAGTAGSYLWACGKLTGAISDELFTLTDGDGTSGQYWTEGVMGITEVTNADWHHFAFVWNSGTTSYDFYWDGTNYGDGADWSTGIGSPFQNINLTFGEYNTGASTSTQRIDEFMMLNASLSANQVQQWRMNNSNGTFWPFPPSAPGPASNKTLTIQAINNFTGVAISGFCARLNSSLSLCNTTGTTIKFLANYSRLYDVLVYNVSGGTFFNYTIEDVNFTVGSNKNVYGHHWQGLIRLNATQLFTISQIQSFNATNSNQFNETTTGSLRIKALNGSNNIQVEVLGNYTQNVSCTIPTPLQTVNCQVSGFYDNKLDLSAHSGSTVLDDFTYSIVNGTLGGTLYSGTATSVEETFNLLQGYNYGITISKPGYVTNNTQFTTNASTNDFNVTLDGITINITFRDELNRSLIGTNITAIVIEGDGTQNLFNTNTSTIGLEGVFEPGNYTLRYSATGYSTRDYYFVLQPADINITAYLIRESDFTPGTVEVRTTNGLIVVGAIVKMIRFYGDPTIPDEVQMATTNSIGQAVMVAESITGFYSWQVEVNGELRFEQTTPELLALESDGLWHKIFIINESATEKTSVFTGFLTGFLSNFTPTTTLTPNTPYKFTGQLVSSFWAVTNCSFYLVNASSGALLAGPNSTFCSASGGTGTIPYTTTGGGYIKAIINVTTADFSAQYMRIYQVTDFVDTNFTLKDTLDDVGSFDRAGFGDFNRFIITIVIIIAVVLSANRASQDLLTAPEETLWLMATLTVFFSYIGWMTLPIPGIPSPVLQQYLFAIFVVFIAILEWYRKSGVSQ